MRVLAVLFGLILLLPGVCSLAVMAFTVPEMTSGRASVEKYLPLILLWVFCFAVSFGGFLMIRHGIGRNRPPR